MLRIVGLTHQQARMQSTAPIIKKIDRILVANRGEIAIRVMKTARKMGIETVAVFSDADRNGLFIRKADKAYHIGPATASESYLNIDKVIDTALKAGAQAIHPGYGFLSENANFAEKCAEAGIVFIGPPVKAIQDMGSKKKAKQIMQDANVPVVDGFHGEDRSDDNLKQHAKKIGYPVMLKAVYGGGGKGMRIAWNEKEFDEKIASARNEARKSFGNDDMIVEQFVVRPRHVEVQVFGDHHGNYVHLWERDCSVQRRHQKIIEEAPAPLINMDTRHKLGQAAVRAAAAVDYVGAGTVEFIMDPNGKFYFMEMNTRLQVEHPVTEAITGADLVEWQLRVAQGENLPVHQKDIPLNGHAFECRVYAEDTKNGAFMPTAGKLDYVSFPSTARVDTGVISGDEVSVHYDPMIAKVIVWGSDRATAAAKLDAALKETIISGLPTNIDFVRMVLRHPEFIKGNVYTDFIPDHQKELFTPKATSLATFIEGAVAQFLLERPVESHTPFEGLSNFRLNHPFKKLYKIEDKEVLVSFIDTNEVLIKVDDQTHKVYIRHVERNDNQLNCTVECDGKRWYIKGVQVGNTVIVSGEDQAEYVVAKSDFAADSATGAGGASSVARAPMPGIIEKVFVQIGDLVKQGESLISMTAMKMEYIIKAPADVKISAVTCAPGKNVAKNTVLVKFENDEN